MREWEKPAIRDVNGLPRSMGVCGVGSTPSANDPACISGGSAITTLCASGGSAYNGCGSGAYTVDSCGQGTTPDVD